MHLERKGVSAIILAIALVIILFVALKVFLEPNASGIIHSRPDAGAPSIDPDGNPIYPTAYACKSEVKLEAKGDEEAVLKLACQAAR